jgi:hypothetical protein
MKILIMFYLFIFLAFFLIVLVIKFKIESNVKFFKLYKKSILFYSKYINLKNTGKLQNTPMVNKILKDQIDNLKIFNNVKAFNQISVVLDKDLDNKRNKNKYILELKEIGSEIIEIYDILEDINVNLLKAVSKILYFVITINPSHQYRLVKIYRYKLVKFLYKRYKSKHFTTYYYTLLPIKEIY